jgi:hypothetical protein
MTRSSLVRAWWAVPGALVAGSAVGAAIVIGPTLGEQVRVPQQLAVPVAAPEGADEAGEPAQSTPPHPRKHPANPSPASTGPLDPASSGSHEHSTRVVQPHRPVVSANPDDGEHHDDGEHRSSNTSPSPSPSPTGTGEEHEGSDP